MITILVQLIRMLAQILSLLVIVHVVISYFLSPYHPFRQTVDRLLEPFLAPIRRLVPPVQMIDFSPLILIIAIQIVEYLLITLLTGF